MRVVIVGMGDIGKQLVDELSRGRENELVVIDRDEKRCEQLASELDALSTAPNNPDKSITANTLFLTSLGSSPNAK